MREITIRRTTNHGRPYHHQGHGGVINPLSATFKTTKVLNGRTVTTLEEALSVIERKKRAKAAREYRDRDVDRSLTAEQRLRQTFSIANAISRQKTRQNKVKMPTFGFLTKEIAD